MKQITDKELAELEQIEAIIGQEFVWNPDQGPFFKMKLEGTQVLYVCKMNRFDGAMYAGTGKGPARRPTYWQASLHYKSADWDDITRPEKGSGWKGGPMEAFAALSYKH